VFSFVLLYCLYGEILAAAQFVYSKGVTTYSIPIGAAIITLILMLLQWIVARLSNLPNRFYALSYFPSTLALAMLTDIDADAIRHFHFGTWAWLAPLLLFLFVVAVFIAKQQTEPSSIKPPQLAGFLVPNYLILCIFFLFAGGIHSSSDTFFYELKTERLIRQQDYDGALDVARRSLSATRRLTNLRMHALSKQGRLAEALFDYPQNFGPDGLLCVTDAQPSLHRFDVQDICRSLGAESGRSVRSTERYFQLLLPLLQQRADSLAAIDTTQYANSDSLRLDHEQKLQRLGQQRIRAYDYVLCRLLLKKDLANFLQSLPEYYALHQIDPAAAPDTILPRAYREALAIADSARCDTLTLVRRQNYQTMCDTIADPVERKNLTWRKFGRTYWWYYDNH